MGLLFFLLGDSPDFFLALVLSLLLLRLPLLDDEPLELELDLEELELPEELPVDDDLDLLLRDEELLLSELLEAVLFFFSTSFPLSGIFSVELNLSRLIVTQ